MFLSICCLFLAVSCNYQIFNPNTGSDNNNNDNTIKKTMYFKFQVSGKSSNKRFKYVNEDIYPKEVSIENYENHKTFIYTGKFGDPGYIAIYYFCDDKIGIV